MGPLGAQGEGKKVSACSGGLPQRGSPGGRREDVLFSHWHNCVSSDTGPSMEGSANKRTHRLHLSSSGS